MTKTVEQAVTWLREQARYAARANNTAIGREWSKPETFDTWQYADAIEDLTRQLARARQDLDFVARWCWREGKISDSERLSVIKYHPTIKTIGSGDGS